MINPERLVNDLFDNIRLGDISLKPFCEDHLLRLATPANNPGSIYDPLLTDTTTKYNAYYGKISSEASTSAHSEGQTITMQNALNAAIDKVRNLEDFVAYKFKRDSAIYQEFYPLGLEEYNQAQLGNIGTYFDRFVTAATARLTADAPAEVTAIKDLVAAFKTARATQLTDFSTIESTQTERRVARKNLTLQLTRNLLTIALQNLENPDIFNNYYDPRYLPLSVTEDPTRYTGTLAGNEIKNIVSSGITLQSVLYFKNKGNTALQFSIQDNATAVNDSTDKVLQPGEEYTTSTGDIPIQTAYYINVKNQNQSTEGSYIVEVN